MTEFRCFFLSRYYLKLDSFFLASSERKPSIFLDKTENDFWEINIVGHLLRITINKDIDNGIN